MGQKNISANVYTTLLLILSFRFLSFSLDCLVKHLDKDDFKYLSQEFDSKVLDLVRQKEFYPQIYLSGFEKSKERLPSKKKFYSLMIDEQNVQLQWTLSI